MLYEVITSNRKPDTGDLPYQASADIFSDTSLYQARVDGGMDAKLDDEARMEYENRNNFV